MGRADYLELGTWNATCSLCGSKYKANELKKHWTGWYRCTDCWEPRHPQDFVRGVQDVQTVPWSQPESNTFVLTCTLTGQQAIPELAMPGCMIPSKMDQLGNPSVWAFCTPESNQPLADMGTADCATVRF